jgi:hypothetical protein
MPMVREDKNQTNQSPSQRNAQQKAPIRSSTTIQKFSEVHLMKQLKKNLQKF